MKIFNKSIKYYAKKNKCNLEDYKIIKLKSEKELETLYAILVNKGCRRSYGDWLRYLGSYDLVICLNKDLKVIKTYTNVIFDVSFFADGKTTKYKKPQNISFDTQLLKKCKEVSVWND